MYRHKLGASLESLSQQSDKFFREITTFIALLKDEFQDNRASEAEMQAFCRKHKFNKLIFDHLGINVNFKPTRHKYENASCSVPFVSKNHPFIETWVRPYFNSDDLIKNVEVGAKQYKEFCGMIDPKRAKVSGIYSKIPFEVTLTYGCLVKNDPEISASVILHELGHAWYYLCMLHCTLTSNFFVSAIRQARSGEEKQKVMSILTSHELLKYIEMTEEEILEKESQLEAIVLSGVAQAAQSDINANVYSESACEQMADEFVSKHGASEYTLQIIAKWSSPVSKKSIAFLNGFGVLYAILVAISSITGVAGYLSAKTFDGLLAAVCVTFMTVQRAYSSADVSSKRFTYDFPRERMDKLYQGAVQRLRSDDLTNDEKRSLIESLERMDEVRKSFNDNYNTYTQLFALISPGTRHTLKSIKHQKILEELASNELLVRSNKLLLGA